MEKNFFAYMMASGFQGTIYSGMTSDLPGRVWKHKEGKYDGFTKKYEVKYLVWYEACPSAEAAIKLEKRLKKYKRDWKINLIERENPHWEDLYESICR
jgi:putative endonuclease